MNNQRIIELSKEASFLQREIKLKKDILNIIKKEEIEPYYMQQKKDAIALDEDFNNVVINGVILQERKNITYVWQKEFYEEAIGRGIVHTLLKHGNKLKERFDLSQYTIPKKPENKSLGYTPPKKNLDEIEQYTINLNSEKTLWSAEQIEKKVDNYMCLKKIIDLKESRYNAIKKDLLQEMKAKNIQKTQDGFYLRDEPTSYDFSKMYDVNYLEETVLIATNGIKSVDLFYDKEIVMVDVTEDDLYDIEYIKKRFGEKRINALKKVLGPDFYYVKGFRKETDILNRFPVSTEKVEEAIDNGWLPIKVLKTGRQIKSIDHIKLNFEIVSETSAQKRAEVNYQRFLERGLKHSGYYDQVS